MAGNSVHQEGFLCQTHQGSGQAVYVPLLMSQPVLNSSELSMLVYKVSSTEYQIYENNCANAILPPFITFPNPK